MPNEKFPHYRPKCVADFKLAQPNSINLDEYVNNFKDEQKIAHLYEQQGEILKSGINPEVIEEIKNISRQISFEIARASFPYHYTKYGTAIFGSARLTPEDSEFQEVVEISKALVSEVKIDIYNGGGPGIMDAANIGATKASQDRIQNGKTSKAKTNGLLIKLPFEEIISSSLENRIFHPTFGTRLDGFADPINSVISWDGGGGTDLENAYFYQLKQVGHVESDFPLIMKKSAWEAIQETKMKVLYHLRIAKNKKPLVSPNDLDLIDFYEHPDDVVQAILENYEKWKKDVWNKLDGISQEKIMEGK